MASEPVARQDPARTSPGWTNNTPGWLQQLRETMSTSKKVAFPVSAMVWLAILLAFFLIAGFGAYIHLPSPNAGFASSAAALAVITGIAIAIERLVEVIWTVEQTLLGKQSRLAELGAQIDAASRDLGANIQPFVQGVSDALDTAKSTFKDTQIKDVQSRIQTLNQYVDELVSLAPGNPQVQSVARAATSCVSYLQASFASLPDIGDLMSKAEAARTTIENLVTYLGDAGTEADNPGRQAVSLMMGATLGLVIAACFGLDLVQAAGSMPPDQMGHWGIALTGVIVGFGANPTHEVIKAIQEYKDSKKVSSGI